MVNKRTTQIAKTTKSPRNTSTSYSFPATAVSYSRRAFTQVQTWLHTPVTIRDVVYIALAAVWLWWAVSSYANMTSSSPRQYPVEPHPIVGGHIGNDLTFTNALFMAIVPTIFGMLAFLIVVTLRHKIARRIIIGLQLVTVASLFTWTTATGIWAQSVMQSSTQSHPADTIVTRAACGDIVRTVDNYTYGAHTFYKLKDEGYKLATTYDDPRGTLNSDEDCAKYYALRKQHSADSIVLQIFTYDNQGNPAPYLYKNAGQKNVTYGIFVKQ